MVTPRHEECLKMCSNFTGSVSRIVEIGVTDNSIILELGRVFSAKDLHTIDIVEVPERLGVCFHRLDLNESKLPFPDESMDMVFASEVLEHLYNPDFFLLECRRVLKKKGILMLTTPNLAAWYNRLTMMLGFQPYWSVTSNHIDGLGKLGRDQAPKGLALSGEGRYNHNRVYALRSLKGILRANGFSVKRQKGLPCYDFPHGLVLLDTIISHVTSLSSTMIVMAEKEWAG